MFHISEPSPANPPNSTSATSSSVTLKWIEVDEGNAHRDYVIKWDPPAADSLTNKTVNTNEATVGNLIGSTLYTFSVLSMNVGGDAKTFSNFTSSPTSMLV